jgi:prolyl oligopeptidase
MSRLLGLCLLVAASCAHPTPPPGWEPVASYPDSRQDAVVDTHWGVQVPDPYRWLEDPDSADTRAWVTAQNELSGRYFAGLPEREVLKSRLAALWEYERFGVPVRKAGRLFFTHNNGHQNQSVLYVADGPEAERRPLLDPNALSPDGTVSLAAWKVSPDARYLVWATSDGGSDWNTAKVRDVATGADLVDELKWIKFSDFSWSKDGKGFFYSRYPAPKAGDALEEANKFQQVWYHRVGTPQADDTLVFGTPDQPDWGFDAQVSDDGATLALAVWAGSGEQNLLFFLDLSKVDLTRPGGPGAAEVERAFTTFDAKYDPIGNDGDTWYLWTTKDAPKGRIVAFDRKNPAALRDVVPQTEDVIDGAALVGASSVVVSRLHDARSALSSWDLSGKLLHDLKLPALGTALTVEGDRSDDEVWVAFTSYTSPTSVWRFDAASGGSDLWRAPKLDFDGERYVTEQVFYPSKDGTKIPMFLTYRKGLKRDGANPTLLYGYGGFNNALSPTFKVPNALWLELGGVYAVANLRGGGEYGEDWHQAGTKLNKQNVFDDFIAAAEYLTAEGWTRPDKLGINGRSNGGLLVGAVLTQRPALFGAAIPGVGVMDMLRYHTWTIGWAWASDYGTVADSAEMFKYLLGYSPVHNASPAAYPPTLVITADHDDRVVPAHSYKFTAALQKAQLGRDPVLIRVATRAGHGAGKPTSMLIEDAADELSFLARSLGVTAR